ncbi:hypothetical protein CPT_Silvanus_016 [Stenotrophomonas phage Silvanus]|nr:hypothetical protein CPT_Silvanus_016 [Stenotrophomonas phage Silvanus]
MSTFLEYRQRVSDNVGMLAVMRLEAASFPEPLCVCNDTRNWTLNGVEYIGLPFGFKLPDDVQGSAARAQLVIDNVGRGITDYLERVQPGEVVMAYVGLCNKISPLQVSYDIWLPVTNVSVSGVLATADCGADHIMRQQAVKLRMYPHLTPGAFA